MTAHAEHLPAPTAAGIVLAPAPRASVVVKAMDDGSVLFAPETELYFGLNQTGTFIWRHLHPVCETVDDICAALGEAFQGGEPVRIRRDVERLLGLLVEKKLADARGDG